MSDDPGYGVQDYSRYLYKDAVEGAVQNAVQVKFPFPVIQKTIAYYKSDGETPVYVDRYYYANTWIPIKVGNTIFTVPYWIKEIDSDEVQYRSVPENAQLLDDYEIKDNKTRVLSSNFKVLENDRIIPITMADLDMAAFDDILQEDDSFHVYLYDDKAVSKGKYSLLNTNGLGYRLLLTNENNNAGQNEYVALCYEGVSVSGRVYGMNIVDISDYPSWKNYFRNSDGTIAKNFISSGMTNRARIVIEDDMHPDALHTMPTVNGSNPEFSNTGIMNPGYAIKYEIETVGNMSDANDYVKIVPTFRWIDRNGNDTGKVNVYYANTTSTGDFQNLIKVGSNQDKLNKKVVSLDTFDLQNTYNYGKIVTDEGGKIGFDYSDAEERVHKASSYLGVSKADLLQHKEETWSMNGINLSQYQRLYDGISHTNFLNEGVPQAYKDDEVRDKFEALRASVALASASSGYSLDDIYKGVQHWYGEYYLPSAVYVTRESDEEVQKQCKDLTGLEECWLSNGYLVVNFEIVTVNGGSVYLAYDNTDWNVSCGAKYDGTMAIDKEARKALKQAQVTIDESGIRQDIIDSYKYEILSSMSTDSLTVDDVELDATAKKRIADKIKLKVETYTTELQLEEHKKPEYQELLVKDVPISADMQSKIDKYVAELSAPLIKSEKEGILLQLKSEMGSASISDEAINAYTLSDSQMAEVEKTLKECIEEISQEDVEGTLDKSGVCDMWARESYVTKKKDASGLTFSLQEGDVILYQIKNKPGTNNSVSNDYEGAGTH